MTTAPTPNGNTIFPGISSDPGNKLNMFLDTDGNYKWTIADGTVVLTVNTTTGLITPLVGSGVTSITGTANQITASAATGAVTLSMPTAVIIATSLAVTANTASSFAYSNASKQLVTTAAPTNGQLLVGSTGAVPVVASLTGTANQLTVTPGAGSITLSIPAAATVPGSLTVTTRTGTKSTFACFDVAGKLVESATACA